MDSCSDCPKRKTCREICNAVEAKLPKMWDGRSRFADGQNPLDSVRRFVANRDTVRSMLDYRDRLTDAQREIFDLYFNDGLHQREIAELLGIRRNTVDEHLMRARARIRRLMAEDARKGNEPGVSPL